MTELVYRVSMDTNSKGAVFSAKDALRSTIRQNHIPISQVRLVSKSTDRAIIDVTIYIDDRINEDTIRGILKRSGRVVEGSYEIRSIDPVDPHEGEREGHKARVEELEDTIERLTDERDLLNARLAEHGAAAVGVSDPISGILAYFSTLSFNLEGLIDDEIDRNFIYHTRRGEIEDSLYSYIRHRNGKTDLTGDEIDFLLAFDHGAEAAKISEEEKKIIRAREELEYARRVRDGREAIPERIRELVLSEIESKGYDSIIGGYENALEELERNGRLAETFNRDKERYEKLRLDQEVIDECGEYMPLLLAYNEDDAIFMLYLPIELRSLSGTIVNDLKKYFSRLLTPIANGSTDLSVESDEERFFSYFARMNSEQAKEYAQKVSNRMPVALQLAGISRFIPYRLGI